MVKNREISYIVLLLFLLALLPSACSRERDPTPDPLAPEGSSSAKTAADQGSPSPMVELRDIPDVGSTASGYGTESQSYTVASGDTLSAIAARFGTTVDALVKNNQIANPNALQVGQELQIPSTQVAVGPDLILLPNSEFVYGPAYVNFDVAAYVARQGGYLSVYQENVGGELLTGAEIVILAAHHYSVGPRLLLTVLEMRSGWVTNPSPAGNALAYPMGYMGGGWESLNLQLTWASDRLNQGYYDWRGRGMGLKVWSDGTATRYAPTLNAATAGLQYFFALDATKTQWDADIGNGPGSFYETYRRLFGDPGQYAIEPLVPANTVVPEMSLPYAKGQLWLYSGGPHGGWGDGGAWSAIDFDPNEGYLGCQRASNPARAVAPGLIIYSRDGEVMLDLDGDGYEQTGWVFFYLHMASEGRVAVDTRVKEGDPIGYPSCEGGYTEATHLHIARKFNGEWIAADGPLPLVLSGWQFHSSGESYEGTASRGDEQRTACECRERDDFNGIPTR